MNIETVQAEARPMLRVSRSSTMSPEEIGGVISEAFGTIGAFIGQKQITAAGPPMAVYRDWDEASGRMAIDIGFAVSDSDLAKAEGEVTAGETPSGKAMKAVHRGPYDRLRESYARLMAHLKETGQTMAGVAWEVYVSDPEETPADELVTEIYMSVS